MATAKPRAGINLRKAKAGQLILENPELSQAQALTQAKYAPSTAKAAKRNGLSADQCVAEAVKADPSINPSRLLSQARLVLSQKLAHVEGKPELTKLGELARTVDVVERWYAGHDRDRGKRSAVDTVDRLEQLSYVLAELERRGKITVNATADPTQDEP